MLEGYAFASLPCALMDRSEVRQLLQAVAARDASVDQALAALTLAPLRDDGAGIGVRDLGFARLDTARGLRTGDPEVIYGEGKTPGQVVALLSALAEDPGSRPALATRLTPETQEAVRSAHPTAVVNTEARTAVVGELPEPTGRVVVVSAGTSDGPAAAEAAVTARAFGAGVECISDVGVAGLHRLLAVRDQLHAADCLIVLAGMEGALPSVVGGLVGGPIVAVPTSVGYGAGLGGVAALLAMLSSCAPGIAVCNIDNGFGAGVFAARVARRAVPRTVDVRAPAASKAR